MENRRYNPPNPIIDQKEDRKLGDLQARYDKLIAPGALEKIKQKAGTLVPQKLKEMGGTIGTDLTDAELVKKTMEFVGDGFGKLEEIAAKRTITEEGILKAVNKEAPFELTSVDEICLLRSYKLEKVSNGLRDKSFGLALAEGGACGFFSVAGIPLNLAISMLLNFRAVQSIAMVYGYDVKNDPGELQIAGDVFTEALNPVSSSMNNEPTSVVAKFMAMGQLEALKKIQHKTWEQIAKEGGLGLLIVQLRATANAAAKKALDKAGKKQLEHTIFDSSVKQVGKKLTKDAVGRSIPVVSIALGALLDSKEIHRVTEYADIFYHRRFLLEKELRVNELVNNPTEEASLIEEEIIDVDFEK